MYFIFVSLFGKLNKPMPKPNLARSQHMYITTHIHTLTQTRIRRHAYRKPSEATKRIDRTPPDTHFFSSSVGSSSVAGTAADGAGGSCFGEGLPPRCLNPSVVESLFTVTSVSGRSFASSMVGGTVVAVLGSSSPPLSLSFCFRFLDFLPPFSLPEPSLPSLYSCWKAIRRIES